MTGVTQNAVKDDAAFAPQLARDLERVSRRGVDAGAVVAAVDFEPDVQGPGPPPPPPPTPPPPPPPPPCSLPPLPGPSTAAARPRRAPATTRHSGARAGTTE